MINHKLRHLPLAAAALVACAGAHAGYTSPDGDFTLSGFGTLGAAKTSTDDVIMNYPGQRGGATKHASFDPDTKLAFQGTYKFTPTFSATSQVMTKLDGDGQYAPNLEWAFGKWQATPGLTIRAGRMGAPYFMISDFRDVGYANNAVRPQLEVYGQVPVSQFDGGDIAYQMNLGETTLTSTLWAGDSHSKYTSALNKPSSVLDIKQTVGINFNADLGNGITVKLGHTRGKINVKNDAGTALGAGAAALTAGIPNAQGQLAAGLAQLNGALASAPLSGLPDSHPAKAPVIAQRNAVAAQSAGVNAQAAAATAGLSQVYSLVNPDADKATFNGVGVTYDVDSWILNAEYTKRTTKGFISDTTGWYVQAGYRLKAFTPYIGYAKIGTDRRASNPVTWSATGVTSLDNNMRSIINGVEQTLNTQKFDQKTITIGSRWDIAPNIALKAQWDRTSKPGNSGGVFLSSSSELDSASAAFIAKEKTVHVFSLSADFIF